MPPRVVVVVVVVVPLLFTVCAKELKFMHITKTGGTSIEAAGKRLNVSWGKFHTFAEKAYGLWHDLPTKRNPSLIRKYDWFTVVRNPFSRVVSEFWCPWGGRGRPSEVNVSSFNVHNGERADVIGRCECYRTTRSAAFVRGIAHDGDPDAGARSGDGRVRCGRAQLAASAADGSRTD